MTTKCFQQPRGYQPDVFNLHRLTSFLFTTHRRAPEEFFCGARMVVGKLTEV